MITKPTDLLTQHSIRRSEAQKEFFRRDLVAYIQQAGHEVQVENVKKGVHNIVIGDPEKAKYLITAHYDTPATNLFPNLLLPKNHLLFYGYQIGLILFYILAAFAVGYPVFLLTSHKAAAFLAGYAVYMTLAVMPRLGFANRNNYNDNTSGVVTLLEILMTLPEVFRDRVCFVLFDLEEAGLVGSMSYQSKHKQETKRQLVLNADCIGDGDEILFIPGKNLRKQQRERVEGWKALCPAAGEKSIAIHDDGICFYPSDHANFPWGVGIAAFRRGKAIGLYCNRIHTPKDTICEVNNVILIRDMLIRIIEKGN